MIHKNNKKIETFFQTFTLSKLKMLFEFNDKSKMTVMSTCDMLQIPNWKGNRILDIKHCEEIKYAIGDTVKLLDHSPFRVVVYKEMDMSNNPVEQKYLIDGQHRANVIKAFTDCNPFEHFNVLVIEKHVESEADAIDYFNTLNNVKPQRWKHDISLLTNKYILALEKEFNKDKKNPFIRNGVTKRPYLSCDKLREVLKENGDKLKQHQLAIDVFVLKVKNYNKKELSLFEAAQAYTSDKNAGYMDTCIKKKFALAFDQALPWVKECL